MSNTGIAYVDFLFNICVILLAGIAEAFGVTYEEINVWLFCFVGPICLVRWFYLERKVRIAS